MKYSPECDALLRELEAQGFAVVCMPIRVDEGFEFRRIGWRVRATQGDHVVELCDGWLLTALQRVRAQVA